MTKGRKSELQRKGHVEDQYAFELGTIDIC